MEHTDEDPAPAVIAEQRQKRLIKFVLNELVEAAKDCMRVYPDHQRTVRLALTSVAPAPRISFGRKTKPMPVVKTVWHIGVLLSDESDPMALYVGTDGTPYCAYYLNGVGEQHVELTEDLLRGLPGAMLEDILATVQAKRSTLELLSPIED